MNPGFTQVASLQRSRISVARPRKLRKPITSVTVVRITAPASAGSNPMRLTVSGTSTPPSAAEQKLIVNAEPITSDSGRSRYQIQTITPSSEPSDLPFISKAEERRVGKEGGSKCRYRGVPHHEKKKKKKK